MGYTKEEYYSSEFNFLDLITPENRELVVSNFTKHAKGEDTAPYEYELITKDRTRINAILNTKIINYDEEPAILGIVTNVTERKLMQHTLEESEEKFRTITNSIRDAIIMVDNEAKVGQIRLSCGRQRPSPSACSGIARLIWNSSSVAFLVCWQR